MILIYKEVRQTHYWLRLLKDSGFLNEALSLSLINDCDELLIIIGSIQKTLKSNALNP